MLLPKLLIVVSYCVHRKRKTSPVSDSVEDTLSDECSLIFIRDLRIDNSAPAYPRDIVIPGAVSGWTAQDVLSKFGPDDPTFTAELYTVAIQYKPNTLRKGKRLSGNLMGIAGPVPPGHLELVLKPMSANGEPGRLAVVSDQTEDIESLSDGSNQSDTDTSDDLEFCTISSADETLQTGQFGPSAAVPTASRRSTATVSMPPPDIPLDAKLT